MITDLNCQVISKESDEFKKNDKRIWKEGERKNCQFDFNLSLDHNAVPMITIHHPPSIHGMNIFLDSAEDHTYYNSKLLMKELATLIDAAFHQYPQKEEAEYYGRGEQPPTRKSLLDCFDAIDNLGKEEK